MRPGGGGGNGGCRHGYNSTELRIIEELEAAAAASKDCSKASIHIEVGHAAAGCQIDMHALLDLA